MQQKINIKSFQILNFNKQKYKGDKMFKKTLILALTITAFLLSFSYMNAQEQQVEKKEMKMTIMQHDDMENCMNKVAADGTMRMQMMDKMINHTKGDKEGMMQMCKMMMENPEMHTMMKEMMHKNGGMMKDGMMKNDGNMDKQDKMENSSGSTNEKSDHESHHPEK